MNSGVVARAAQITTAHEQRQREQAGDQVARAGANGERADQRADRRDAGGLRARAARAGRGARAPARCAAGAGRRRAPRRARRRRGRRAARAPCRATARRGRRREQGTRQTPPLGRRDEQAVDGEQRREQQLTGPARARRRRSSESSCTPTGAHVRGTLNTSSGPTPTLRHHHVRRHYRTPREDGRVRGAPHSP